MEIREAAREDVDKIMPIIDAARQLMRDTGNLTQWTEGYPSRQVILDDIKNKHAFLCVENAEAVGYFCFIQGEDPDPCYKVIEGGAWLSDGPYGVIHRLASSGKVKGIAEQAFDFAFNQIGNIKVDTHHDNLPMQNFLQKNGFSYCGIIYVGDGSPRDAFQKRI
ncbi:MAG TPA: GNAT family N-acetyltransferase [Flavobacterium sp.]|jgi:hypothetical protein